MPAEHLDVASAMAEAWNDAHPEATPAQPVDMWPCCRALVDAGLLVGQQEDLAAVAIGPFKIAIPRAEHQVRDFVEVVFPSAVAALPAGQPLTAAVSGLLSAACLTFVKLFDRGIAFGRSPADQQRWTVLMHIYGCNRLGFYPTICDVIGDIASAVGGPIRPGEAETAIGWLIDQGLLDRLSIESPGLKTRI